jgi:hypothetical protein
MAYQDRFIPEPGYKFIDKRFPATDNLFSIVSQCSAVFAAHERKWKARINKLIDREVST